MSRGVESYQKSLNFQSFLEPLIEQQGFKFSKHPLLLDWLRNDSICLNRRLALMAPPMIEFSMGFQDDNIYYLQCPEVKIQTTFEQVINNLLRKIKRTTNCF